MDTYWAALQQSIFIIYYPILPWLLGIGVAGAALLSVVAIVGRLIGKYIR